MIFKVMDLTPTSPILYNDDCTNSGKQGPQTPSWNAPKDVLKNKGGSSINNTLNQQTNKNAHIQGYESPPQAPSYNEDCTRLS